jgi:hypothetical protein
MVPVSILISEDEARSAQAAATRAEMSLGEFCRWAVVMQSASVVGANGGAGPIEQPWGEPHPVKPKGVQL